MNEIKIITVLLPAYLNKMFVYEDRGFGVSIGDIIQVPFGKQTLPALCTKVESINADEVGACIGVQIEKVKCVKDVVQKNVFTEKAVSFFIKFGEYNMIEKRGLFDLIVPSLLYSQKNHLLNSVVAVCHDADLKLHDFYKTKATKNKATRLLEFINVQYNGNAPVVSLVQEHGLSIVQIEKMLKADIIQKICAIVPKKETSLAGAGKVVDLNSEQVFAVDYVSAKLNEFNPVLLYGVTGSGKTEVYISLIEKIITSTEKQALIMLPEITMVSGMLERLEKMFGVEVVVWHSSVSTKDKFEQMNDIISGKARIVIGARSAVLLPFHSLGIIVVDEEHDTSYKQDEMPTYNARDMAVLRASIEMCPILLCSATPSIESYVNAENKKYSLVRLRSRFNDALFPTTHIADTTENSCLAGTNFTQYSVSAIKDVLLREEQVIIFLNRRGYSRMIACKDCGFVYECPNCDNRLVYHKERNVLKCHYCLHCTNVPRFCTNCNKEMTFIKKGFPGLEKIKEEVEGLFPNARIGLMSADTMSKNGSVEGFLEDVNAGRVDIIIGTQIATKGFNFQKLRLVVALNVNIDGVQGDLRVFERTYQLLVQVAGRAGRFGGGSGMIVQTNSPDNPVLQSMISGIEDHFYKEELKRRQDGFLPPFSKQIVIIVSSANQDKARECMKQIHLNILKDLNSKQCQGIKMFGPTENTIHKLKTKYRYHILLQGASRLKLADLVSRCTKEQPKSGDLTIKIDVDPLGIL